MDEDTIQTPGGPAPARPRATSLRDVPWQIWVVVVILAAEGLLSNLPAILKTPIAAFWLLAKCVLILGLLKRWRWVFILCLVLGAIHTLYFSIPAPVVALINLVLVLLVASSLRFYFPKKEGVATGQ